MDFVFNAARWALGKALAPLVCGALEAWQASKKLGSNITALKMELLYAQAMLDNTEGRELRSPALKELLLNLQELAFDADDALDELDYFRIQDSVEHTFNAADAHPGGLIQDTTVHTTAVVEEAVDHLRPSSPSQHEHTESPAPADTDEPEQEEARRAVACCDWRRRARQWTRGSALSPPNTNPQPDAKVRGGAYKLASCVRDLGKHFTSCSSPPPPIQAAVDSGVLDTTTPEQPHRGSVVVRDDILDATTPNTNPQPDTKVRGKLASCACHAVRGLGKHFTCCSLPHQESVVAPPDANSDALDAITITPAPTQQESVVAPDANPDATTSAPDQARKLKFHRARMSKRLEDIAGQFKLLCAKVAVILNLELLESNRRMARDIAANLNATRLLEQEGKQIIYPPNDFNTRPITSPYISEPELYGREEETTKILRIITGGGKDLTVLPVIGQGGIGKTTLAKHIYEKVKNDFHFRIWICVSDNFGVPRLFNEIFEQIRPKAQNESNDTPIETRIETRLKSSKFFLVLDDMWNCVDEQDWKRLIAPLGKGQKEGNVILVTSRFPKLAQMVRTINDEVQLEGLKGPAFEELFIKCVFDNINLDSHHSELLNTTGKKIMEKLKGSPLAAKTVGRLLRNHPDRSHWETILNSEEWKMQTGDHDIMPALKLSYDYLPFHLQRCFSFCALFPEDYNFNRNELIHWWIGLDILQSDRQNKRVEDIGLDNLKNLVEHGFLKEDIHVMHTRYLMHDLLRDLGLKVASHECLSIDCTKVTSVEIWPSVRHLSIIIDDDMLICESFISELEKLVTRLKIENLRTLMIFGLRASRLIDIFCKLIRKAKGLRVFHVSGATNDTSGVGPMLADISPLAHLRYLSLKNSNISYLGTHRLPSMLSRLYHLRILDMQNWWGDLDLIRDISNLPKLRHMDLTELGVYRKNCLCKLRVLRWSSSGVRLGCWYIDGRNNEIDVDDGEILEALQPHKNLQELGISWRGGHSCPTWLGSKLSVKALKSLHLVDVRWEFLPFLGQMEEIQELKLSFIDTLKEFDPCLSGRITSQSFCNLKRLELMNLWKLEKWVIGEKRHSNLFHQLEVLIIIRCPNLLTLPFTDIIDYPPREDQDVKIHRFPKLQKLEITGCPNVSPLPPIPWTQTLCSVDIKEEAVEEGGRLAYTKSLSNVQLFIREKDKLHSLDENTLVFNNLTDLQTLTMQDSPPLEFKHLQKLRSLKSLHIFDSTSITLLGSDSEAKWPLPIEHLTVCRCPIITGKELTQLISRLPKLSELKILSCDKITQVGVAVKQQLEARIPSSSMSAARIENTQAICMQHDIEQEVEEIGKDDDGLLLFPIHLSDSLRRLRVEAWPGPIRLLAYPPLRDDYKTSQTEEGGWLHALRSLQELEIENCHLLSADPFSSARFPFPSSLEKLELRRVYGLETLKPEALSNLTRLTELKLFSVLGWRKIKRGGRPMASRDLGSAQHIICL